jgi:hypothetical protein
MVYSCQIRTYEAGRDATERQTGACVANSVANRRLRLVQFLHAGVGIIEEAVAAVGGGRIISAF